MIYYSFPSIIKENNLDGLLLFVAHSYNIHVQGCYFHDLHIFLDFTINLLLSVVLTNLPVVLRDPITYKNLTHSVSTLESLCNYCDVPAKKLCKV